MKQRYIREYQIPGVYGISIATVRKWEAQGRLHPGKPSKRIKLYSIEELDKVISEPEIESKPRPGLLPIGRPVFDVWPGRTMEKVSGAAL